jgi:L-ascorbate metabolism protein UlaG (beta-lactamase superfamily)
MRMTLQRSVKLGKKFQNPVPTTVGGPGMMFKVLPLYLMNRAEREPRESPGPFQTDPEAWLIPPASGLRITWFGHASMLIEMDGTRLLVDPVWDERASPVTWFGPKRFFAPTVSLADLPTLDAVLLSHDHYDHMGEQTVRALASARPGLRWVAMLGVGTILRRFGVPADHITELDWTESTQIVSPNGTSIRVTSVPTRHFSGRSLNNRFETLWGAFVLRGPHHNVYCGADTGLWPGLADIGEQYGPFDLQMIEIGAFNQMWHQIHLGPDGGAEAFARLGGAGPDGGGLLMPIHWGLFDLALHAWREPIERITQLATKHGLKLFSPEPGSPTEVIPGRDVRSDWWKLRPRVRRGVTG